MKQIREYALEDANFIKEEFDLIDPEFIICGYTFGILKDVLGISPISCDKEYRVYKNDEKIFINYWHPAAHFPADMSYYTLCALIQKNLQRIS